MTRRQIRRIAHDELVQATTRFQARLRLDQDPSQKLVAVAMQTWLEEMTAMALAVITALQAPTLLLGQVTDATIAAHLQKIRRARETMELADQ